MSALINHLWQSTLFAGLIALLALALKDNAARWRSRLWLAASLKFLAPFAVLMAVGAGLGWRAAPSAPFNLSLVLEPAQAATGAVLPRTAPPVVHPGPDPAVWLLPVWACGFMAVLLRWWRNCRRVRAAVRRAVPMHSGPEFEIWRQLSDLPLLLSPDRIEPGIAGVLRPVLLWSAAISPHLTGAQTAAIMMHEACHVRRRDNLAAALHMFVEAVFWFHPLVWWLRTRWLEEREKACDEAVLAQGSRPEIYAGGILKACRHLVAAPQWQMAGVAGPDLNQRIERIMSRRVGRQLDAGRKLLLAAAGAASIAGPLLFGIAQAPLVRAQTPAARKTDPSFEVASIKPNHSADGRVMFRMMPGGRVECTNISAKMLIMMAYDLKPNQISGGPGWMDADHYDISAKGEGPQDPENSKAMMRSLLRERFKLAAHRETKDMPIYEIVAAKGGPKLKPATESGEMSKGQFFVRRGQMELKGVTLAQMAENLSRVTGKNVYDRTGLSGKYDVKLEWTPDESEPMKGPPEERQSERAPAESGPSIFTAMQEQLGLKLQPARGPVDVLVVDHIERASEN